MHLLPDLVEPAEMTGAAVVVIDVLRASTTIVQALEAGALAVVPCLEVDKAQKIAANFPRGEVVLGGERGGVRIEGFDLGNSPCEYTSAAVGGKTVVFTTTNGTQALRVCRQAAEVCFGAFVNASAVVRWMENHARLHVVCAGTRGEVTGEDLLLAGMLTSQIAIEGVRLNDSARLVRDAWRSNFPDGSLDGSPLHAVLCETLGGRNLAELGLDSDIVDAAQLDRCDIVPRWQDDKIVAAGTE